MAKRKAKKRRSGKRNTRPRSGWRNWKRYSAGELFLAGLGALLIVLVVGIVISSLVGD